MEEHCLAEQNGASIARRAFGDPEELYLALLKKCLTRYLFYEQWRPLEPHASRGLRVAVYVLLRKLFASQNMYLMRPQCFDEDYALNGGPWNNRYSGAETMIGMHRLQQLRDCILHLQRSEVPGDLIETGAWRGGATIFMRAVLKAHGDTTRRVWVADSFMGMPQPARAAFPQDIASRFHMQPHMIVSLDDVKRNFARYDLLDDQVQFLAGWFRDTLPAAPIDHLALMRLDSLMYESTTESLEFLYPKLSIGGYVIIDDYYTPLCTAAVDDYRRRHRITEPLEVATWPRLAVYWRRCS